jgi:transposase-like protein
MSTKKSVRKQRHYDEEFKKNAIKLVENGRSVKSVSYSLGISKTIIYDWLRKKKEKAVSSKVSKDIYMDLDDKTKLLKLEQELSEVK